MTVVPNIVNVVPERCEAEVDTRNVPLFTPQAIIAEQRKILDDLSKEDPDFNADVSQIERETIAWTGYRTRLKPVAIPFYIEPNHWLVKMGSESIKQVLGREPELKIWRFTTECHCFAERRIPVIGFGPGEERFTHCSNEVISVEDLITATKVYAVLAAKICNLDRHV